MEPLVNSFLAGESAALLMYGPRGTGKTFTLLGSEPPTAAGELQQPGAVQRAVADILHSLEVVPRDSFSLYATYSGEAGTLNAVAQLLGRERERERERDGMRG